MTGFARRSGEHDGSTWTWEVRSVNGRGLDVRCRLNGFEALEAVARQTVGKRFKRGSMSLNLQVVRAAGMSQVRVNEEVLQAVLAQLERLRELDVEATSATLDGILGLKGVLEQVDEPESEDEKVAREAALLKGLEAALGDLAGHRAHEGGQIAAIVADQLAEIERLTQEAQELAAVRPERIAERFRAQLDELLGGNSPIAEERLAQEIALLAIKADVREELDRLVAHIATARELLAKDGAVGRQLDFLAQEFNREANTLCSKSSDTTLTRVGLALKSTIDQFREQVQNVE
ncbi:MAG: YicC/YloC family endoribonuclease [Alphaproteobacteria bacterium]